MEIIVVMTLMAVSTALILVPALFNRRSQLELESRAYEVLAEIKNAQNLAKGVLWEDDAFRPKAVMIAISNSATPDAVDVEILGINEFYATSSASKKTIEGIKIKDVTKNGAASSGDVGNTLYIAFDVPKGLPTNAFLAASESIATSTYWNLDSVLFSMWLKNNDDIGLTLGDKNDEFAVGLSLKTTSGDFFIAEGAGRV